MSKTISNLKDIWIYASNVNNALQAPTINDRTEARQLNRMVTAWYFITYVFAIKNGEKVVYEIKKKYKPSNLDGLTLNIREQLQDTIKTLMQEVTENNDDVCYVSHGYMGSPNPFGIPILLQKKAMAKFTEDRVWDEDVVKMARAVYPDTVCNDVYLDQSYVA